MEWDGKTLRTQTWSEEAGYQDYEGPGDHEEDPVATELPSGPTDKSADASGD
jgi:hypothetical protein